MISAKIAFSMPTAHYNESIIAGMIDGDSLSSCTFPELRGSSCAVLARSGLRNGLSGKPRMD